MVDRFASPLLAPRSPGGGPGPRPTSRAFRSIAALLISASIAPIARAQPAPEGSPSPAQREADERFQEGKALMAKGLIAEGCAKLARSLELLRRGGTLLNLAVCRQKEGRYATAFGLFQEALAIATADGRTDREELARTAIEELRTRLSWMEIAPSAGADAAGLEITRDGVAIPREAWGTPIPVDPGAHTVAATAPGRQRYEITITLDGPGKKSVLIPALEPIRVEPPAATAPAVPPARTSVPDSAPPLADSGAAWRRPSGIAALAAGLAGLSIGGGFGVKAILDAGETRRLCPGDVCTTDEGLARHTDARTAATVANIALPAGLAVAGVGLFLLFWSPAPRTPPGKAPTGLWMAPVVGREGAGAGLGGTW